MRLEAATLGGLLATGVVCSAAQGLDVAQSLERRQVDLQELVKREPTRTVNNLQKRNDVFGASGGIWPTVAVPAGFTLAGGVEITPLPEMESSLATASASAAIISSILASSTPMADPQLWNQDAEQNCMDAVMKLNGKASNPAGLAVCYNLPYLDQQRGTFEAELRMYNISIPTAPFVGVTPAMMSVTLQYQGATIQKSDGALPVKRSIELHERQIAPMQPMAPVQPMAPMAMAPDATMPPMMMESLPPATVDASVNGNIQELAIRRYVGQVNKELMVSAMNLTQFQPLLIPQITISAVSPVSGQIVSTSLSSTEASFVVGVFSMAAGSISDPKFLLGKPVEQIAAAALGSPTPFVVPGLSLGVFPVGLIVTAAWILIFSLAVGLGTIGRVQFREEYRRMVKAQEVSGTRTL